MPNTKSAERRMRGNERKRLHNRAIASRLRKLEKGLRDSVADGKKADATKALPVPCPPWTKPSSPASSPVPPPIARNPA